MNADGAAFGFAAESLAKNGKAAWHQDGSAGSLDEPSQQQDGQVRRHGTGQRCAAEQADTDNQNAAASESVSRGTSQQQQGIQGEKIGVDDALQSRCLRLQRRADGGKPSMKARLDAKIVDVMTRRG